MIKCYHRFDQNFQPSANQYSANIATTDSFSEPLWFANFGAFAHCTQAVENLQYRTSIDGKEKLVVGNGATLNINAIGKSSFTSSSTSFYLNDILYSPFLTEIYLVSQNSLVTIIVFLNSILTLAL